MVFTPNPHDTSSTKVLTTPRPLFVKIKSTHSNSPFHVKDVCIQQDKVHTRYEFPYFLFPFTLYHTRLDALCIQNVDINKISM